MNNNNKIIKTDNKALIIIIIIIIVALIISAVLTALTPKKEKITQTSFVTDNYDRTQSNFKKVNFSGNKIVSPKKMNIYRVANALDLSSELAQKIINEYQLEEVKDATNYWFNDKFILNKNVSENRYAFDLDTKKNQNQVSVVSKEAIKSCLNFYLKYNINLPLIAQEEEIQYLRGNLEQYTAEKESASSLYIPLTYELDGYPVFYQNENNYPFFCRVNNNYQVEKVVFKDFFYYFELVFSIDSIDIDKAIKNIQDGKASIIDAKSKIVEVIDLNWINSADLYSVKIEYRYDEKLKIAYPFYRFEAKIVNSGGIDIQAEIITPAVEATKEK